MPTKADEISKRKAELLAQQESVRAELATIEAEERKASMKGNVLATIASIAAVRAAIKRANELVPGTFSEDRWDIPPQAYPRTGRLAKMADLSETEVANAKAKGERAIGEL